MKKVDARGQRCPMPIVLLAKEVRGMEPGEALEILATDSVFPADLKAWIRKTGHTLVSVDEGENAGEWRAVVTLKTDEAAG